MVNARAPASRVRVFANGEEKTLLARLVTFERAHGSAATLMVSRDGAVIGH
jgi:hypothetical protein